MFIKRTNTIYYQLIQINDNQRFKKKAYVYLYVQTTYAILLYTFKICFLSQKNLIPSALNTRKYVYLCKGIRDIEFCLHVGFYVAFGVLNLN